MQEELELTIRLPESAKKTIIEERHPDFATEVGALIHESLPIHDAAEYESFLRSVTDIISRHSTELAIRNKIFNDEIKTIADDELNIDVPDWGGVAYQHADVKKHIREKRLLVRQSVNPMGTLWLEYHAIKDEHLTVEEGFGLFLTSEPDAWEKGQVTIQFAGPGDSFTLHPGNKHGIIALTDLSVMENSDSSIISDIYSVFQKPVSPA